MDRRWAGKGTDQTEWLGLVWVPQLVHREARGRQAVAEVRVSRRVDRVLEWEVQGASQGWWIRDSQRVKSREVSSDSSSGVQEGRGPWAGSWEAGAEVGSCS